jgi:multicomponent Na+:H+ antiporter subunit C
MRALLALVVGILFGAGVYMLTRRSMVRLTVGLGLLGHAANLLVFTAGGLAQGRPPLVQAGASAPSAGHADPIPQALILTAIVIGFATLAFFLALVHRVYHTVGTDDLHRLEAADDA